MSLVVDAWIDTNPETAPEPTFETIWSVAHVLLELAVKPSTTSGPAC